MSERKVWVSCPTGPKALSDIPGVVLHPTPMLITWTEGLQAAINMGLIVEHRTTESVALPEPDRILGVRDETAPRE